MSIAIALAAIVFGVLVTLWCRLSKIRRDQKLLIEMAQRQQLQQRLSLRRVRFGKIGRD